MTFSDPAVAKGLRRDFVCAWMNKAPKVKYEDGLYVGRRIPQGLENGTGVTNVTAVFASSDGTVIHAMPGYLDPPTFLRHLEFAKALGARLSDPSVSRVERARLYTEAHYLAEKTTRIDLEVQSHKLLASRFMRIDELSVNFFHGLARRGG